MNEVITILTSRLGNQIAKVFAVPDFAFALPQYEDR